jgi:hypothetical protein
MHKAFAVIRAAWNFIVACVLFVRGILSDNGSPSASRVLSALVIAAWVRVAITTHSVPEHTADVGVLVLALYGVNSLGGNIKAAIEAMSNKAPSGGEPH